MVILDVREKDEFEAEHIPESIHVPLSCFARQAPGILRQLEGKPVMILCRSGKRALMAQEQIKGLGFDLPTEVFSGGILEWAKQGKPLERTGKFHIPIMRQVMIIAGGSALAGVILGHNGIGWGYYVSGLMGAGLLFAGVTGVCAMAEVLAWAPWNRSNSKKCDL